MHAGLLTRHLEILLKLPSGCSRDMTRCRNCFGALGMPKESSQENISKKYAECRTCVLCKFFNMHISSQKTDEKRASFHSRNSTSVFMKRSNFHFREKKLHEMSFQQPPPLSFSHEASCSASPCGRCSVQQLQHRRERSRRTPQQEEVLRYKYWRRK